MQSKHIRLQNCLKKEGQFVKTIVKNDDGRVGNYKRNGFFIDSHAFTKQYFKGNIFIIYLYFLQ